MALQSIPERHFDGINGRVAVVVADFHKDIAQGLLEGLEAEFNKHTGAQWQVHRVSGAFEVPLMAQKLASMVQVKEGDKEERLFDVIVVLGCIVKGETYHFDMVANECARGCMEVMLDQDIPVVYQMLAVYDHAQAKTRSEGVYNHGISAAHVALEWLEKIK